MSTSNVGACLCAAVTFEIAPPYRWFAHCHCSLCRKQHGSLFGTGIGVARDGFRWRSGTHDIVHYRATAAFERPFCRHCGSSVPAVSHDEGVWHVPAGLLRGDPGVRPRSHIFVASKSSLLAIGDSLLQHAAYPSSIDLRLVEQPRSPPSSAAVDGSCLCGAVAFTLAQVPRRLVNCYCSLCRRSRGGAFASTLLAAAGAFTWLRGVDRIHGYALPAPRAYRTDFCAACGSPVPTVVAGSPTVLVPAGAIDTALAPLPSVHLYVGSKAAWYEITDAWPQFAELPPRERFTEFLQ